MKVFEYGILKTGDARLAYVRAALYEARDSAPSIVLREDKGNVVGEIHELTRAQVRQRDFLYGEYARKSARTTRGERVQVYVRRTNGHRRRIENGIWLFPRTHGSVYEVTTRDSKRWYGSFREILDQLYHDQWVEGRRRFKESFAQRVKDMTGRHVSTERVERFFRDLARARAVRVRRIWPHKISVTSN